ncbi:transporter, lactate permease (LctP) family [Actinomyces sp. oral taxon 848 str. F0332]|uniref:L-lactate permease n=1 Tax=Peptidiphaga gingivicola TaxID=2741497 RepID=A0A179B2Q6_9ACTO|nr:L-lactate permease [Peptidiphaga gingivicola]EEZ78764.1 transporter, lactate permease (LctP) family [Actinomyces sp. oral taxon 848 str. F0332]OAP85675.1 L-lactate permease [Peptidiphaga gingivicola]
MIHAAYTPSTTAVGSSLALTALLGLLPLVVFFVLLGVFKVKTHVCAIISLAAALAAAILAFGMPVDLALLSATQGAAFGLFPIVYIVIMAVWLYNLTEKTGRSEDVRRVFAAVGKGDMRVQALLIGFCFCGLMEGLAGFGAPVAISCAMLLALGVPAIKAALVTMVGNALNVCFGAMAIPVTTAAKLGNSSADAVGATQGRITPLFLCWIPVLLLGILDGKRGMKQAWPAALAAGVTMGLGHILAANFLSYELTAVFASLLSFASVTLLLRAWRPRTPEEQLSETSSEKLSGSRVALGLLPYWLVVVIFAVAKLWTAGIDVPKALESTDVTFGWPGLDGQLVDAKGQAVKATQFTFSWLSSPGTMLLLTGLIVALVYGKSSSGGKYPFSFGKGMTTLWKTVVDLKLAILTIAVVMALAYVMNLSGQTVAIGTWLAAAGGAFAFLSPILGWVGTAVTGSATSAGALFANLQSTAGAKAGISTQLLLAANEIGGGIGKIVSPQNLAIAATAIKEPGSESTLLRKAAPYSIAFIALLGMIVVLASSGTLGFLITN